MLHDSNLKVVLPPLQASDSGRREPRKQPVVGTSNNDTQQLRASQQPREFHLYVGNLDVKATEDGLKEYVRANNSPIRVLSCEIVRSSRPGTPRAVAAHVVINQQDKTKAFDPKIWPKDVTIRAWRQPKTRFEPHRHNRWDTWDWPEDY
jgi:hypothetical protein